jgi:hypothetical protein
MKARLVLSATLIAGLIGTVAAAQNTGTTGSTGSTAGANPITNGAISPGAAATFVPGVGLVPNTPTIFNGRILPNLFNEGSILPNQFSLNPGFTGAPTFNQQTPLQMIDPFGQTTGTTNGINSGFANGVFPNGTGFPSTFTGTNPTLGVGGGFFPGFGFGFSGPLVDVTGLWGNGVNMTIPPPPYHPARVPILGVNVPVAPVGSQNVYTGTRGGASMRRLSSNRPSVSMQALAAPSDVQERVAGSRQELRQSAEQSEVVNRMQEVMNNRPLREGTVVTTGATAFKVRYHADGVSHTERVPVEDVFFFQGDGQLSSAATRPGALHAGDRVLIPQASHKSASIADPKEAAAARVAISDEVQARVQDGETIAADAVVLNPRSTTVEASADTGIQERVAGSREEAREGRTLSTSAGPGVVTTDGETVSRTTTTDTEVQSRVAGSRQTHRRVTHRRTAR